MSLVASGDDLDNILSQIQSITAKLKESTAAKKKFLENINASINNIVMAFKRINEMKIKNNALQQKYDQTNAELTQLKEEKIELTSRVDNAIREKDAAIESMKADYDAKIQTITQEFEVEKTGILSDKNNAEKKHEEAIQALNIEYEREKTKLQNTHTAALKEYKDALERIGNESAELKSKNTECLSNLEKSSNELQEKTLKYEAAVNALASQVQILGEAAGADEAEMANIYSVVNRLVRDATPSKGGLRKNKSRKKEKRRSARHNKKSRNHRKKTNRRYRRH